MKRVIAAQRLSPRTDTTFVCGGLPQRVSRRPGFLHPLRKHSACPRLDLLNAMFEFGDAGLELPTPKIPFTLHRHFPPLLQSPPSKAVTATHPRPISVSPPVSALPSNRAMTARRVRARCFSRRADAARAASARAATRASSQHLRYPARLPATQLALFGRNKQRDLSWLLSSR